MRPMIPYPGAKGRLAPTLVAMMPQQGRTYVEPFAGRGNVYFTASQSLDFEDWWLNDHAVADFFKALVRTKGSIRVPVRTKEEYIRQKAFFIKRYDRAILLEPYLTYSGGGYLRGGYGGKRSANAQGYSRTLRACANILISTKTRITNLDWMTLGLEQLTSDDFVFLDPPYYGADVRAYSNKFDHLGMVKVLLKAKFKWMLTEYNQDFYVKAFGTPCYTSDVQLACDGRGNRRRLECVWKNF